MLLQTIRKLSRKRRPAPGKGENENLILHYAGSILSKYLTGIEEHLHNLPLLKRFGSSLNTSRGQLLLYMIEFEISNRINRNNFLNAEEKIALLPHCLHDLTKQCISSIDGLDYRCKGCSKHCYINKISTLLKDNDISSYIWKEASRNEMFGSKDKRKKGILGIACLPELIRGIRQVEKRGVPVLGLPLDANRCVRWMGDFYENSFNVKKLASLIAK